MKGKTTHHKPKIQQTLELNQTTMRTLELRDNCFDVHSGILDEHDEGCCYGEYSDVASSSCDPGNQQVLVFAALV
jgi:hypothetical protein